MLALLVVLGFVGGVEAALGAECCAPGKASLRIWASQSQALFRSAHERRHTITDWSGTRWHASPSGGTTTWA